MKKLRDIYELLFNGKSILNTNVVIITHGLV